MKKVAIGLAVAGILILAGILVFKRSGGPSQAAGLVPAEAMVFANVPNIPLAGFRWTRTALAQIAADPEVRAFFDKPFAELKDAIQKDETAKILSALKPGNVYFAATTGSERDFHGILGVQFWGKRADFDNAIAKVRSSLPAPTGEPLREEYRGLEIVSSRHGDHLIHSAAAGRWGFLSNDDALIKDAIDRATGNARTPALASNPTFLKVVSELLSDPDLLVFLQPEKGLERLLAAGRALGARAIPEQVDQIRAVRAVGGAWKIEGEMFRDAFFLLRPESGEPPAPLTHHAMELTTPETTLFCNFVLNVAKLPSWIEEIARPYPKIGRSIAPLAQLIAEGCGPECAVLASWPSAGAYSGVFPGLLLAIQVKNTGPDLLTRAAASLPGARCQTIGNRQIHILPPGIAAAQNERFLVMGTNPESVAAALADHPKTLHDSALFLDARNAYRNSNEAFCFIDTRSIFERSYKALLPVIRLGAAMRPDINSRFDLAKLPKPESIGQHLPPIIFSQKRFADGTRLESSGPVNISQILVLSGAAGSLWNFPLWN